MIKVLDCVSQRHPDISNFEVVGAWEARIKTQYRLEDEKLYMVAVGLSPKGRLIEMIAFDDADDTVIFHANKATKKVLNELGML